MLLRVPVLLEFDEVVSECKGKGGGGGGEGFGLEAALKSWGFFLVIKSFIFPALFKTDEVDPGGAEFRLVFSFSVGSNGFDVTFLSLGPEISGSPSFAEKYVI